MHISFPPFFARAHVISHGELSKANSFDKWKVNRETLGKFPFEKSIVTFICEFSYLFSVILKNYQLYYFVICKYILCSISIYLFPRD